MKINLKKILGEKYIEGLFIIVLVGYSILMAFIYFNGMSSQLISIFNFLSIDGIGSPMAIISAMFFFLVLAKINDLNLGWLKKINWYVLISFYLLLLSLACSVSIAEGLIIEEEGVIFNERLFSYEGSALIEDVGWIECKSKRFSIPVKGDILTCEVGFELDVLENYGQINELEIVKNSIWIEESNFSKKENYSFPGAGDSFLRGIDFLTMLPDREMIEISFNITMENSTFISGKKVVLDLDGKLKVEDRITNNKQIIFSLLSLFTSFSFLAIFMGMNSLRQLIQNKK